MSITAASTVATPTVYGLANCDTVKRARAWLVAQGVSHQFHDFKKSGISSDKLSAWVNHVGWEVLLNRKGTTWRQLADAEKAAVSDSAIAQMVMLAHASVIKRPVVEWPDRSITVGFSVRLFNERAPPIDDLNGPTWATAAALE